MTKIKAKMLIIWGLILSSITTLSLPFLNSMDETKTQIKEVIFEAGDKQEVLKSTSSSDMKDLKISKNEMDIILPDDTREKDEPVMYRDSQIAYISGATGSSASPSPSPSASEYE